MEKTVTAIFAGPDQLSAALQQLKAAGFPPEALTRIAADNPHLHQIIGEETSDVARGALLGAAVGGVGAAIAGVVMSLPPVSVFSISPVAAAIGAGVLGAIAGGLIGVLIGSATGHQVQEEYEYLLSEGGQLLAVNTDRVHAPMAEMLLAELGGQRISTSVHRAHHKGLQQTA
jgi:hypothetical protein